MSHPDRRSFVTALAAMAPAIMRPDARALGFTALTDPLPRTGGGGLSPASDFGFEPGLAYLQTGSLGPTPRPVIDRVFTAWRELELNPAAWGYGAHEAAMDVVRAKAAAFLGCTTEELVLTNCTTEGINWIAQGLSLQPGDRILTTDQEHPGGRVGWDWLARRQGVVLDVVPIAPGDHDAAAIVARFEQAITPQTRVFSFSHLLSSTGLRMPVAELSALARRHGCLSIVDGAQAVGGIAVDVKALGCHAYATSGHKWLLAPKGTGLLYLSQDLGKAVDPIALESGRAAYSASSGVTSIPSVLGLGAAIDYANALGMSRIEAHNLALRAALDRRLRAEVPRVRVVSAPAGPLASPLLSFELPSGVKSGDLHPRLRARTVEVKVVPGQWLNGIRISTHHFNDEADIDRLIRALNAELG